MQSEGVAVKYPLRASYWCDSTETLFSKAKPRGFRLYHVFTYHVIDYEKAFEDTRQLKKIIDEKIDAIPISGATPEVSMPNTEG